MRWSIFQISTDISWTGWLDEYCTHHKWCVLSSNQLLWGYPPGHQETEPESVSTHTCLGTYTDKHRYTCGFLVTHTIKTLVNLSKAWVTVSTSSTLSQSSKHSPCLHIGAKKKVHLCNYHPQKHPAPQKERETGVVSPTGSPRELKGLNCSSISGKTLACLSSACQWMLSFVAHSVPFLPLPSLVKVEGIYTCPHSHKGFSLRGPGFRI